MIAPIAATPAPATPIPTPAFAPVDIVDALCVSTAGIAVPVGLGVVLDVELEVLLDDVDKLEVCELLGTTIVLVPLHSPKSP